MARVLVISDLHAPYENPKAISFLKSVKKEFKTDTVIIIGDEVDHHALSFHDHDPNEYSPAHEHLRAVEHLKPFYREFPRARIVVSNHTSRIFRRAFTSGIPRLFLRDYKDFLKAPKGWEWKDSWVIDNVYYCHGDGFSGGANAAYNAAKNNNQSTVIGHFHNDGGCRYFSSRENEIFALTVGCLIDFSKPAFDYSRKSSTRPTLGCGVVIDGTKGMFIPLT